mgnify:CR=1 FL=1
MYLSILKKDLKRKKTMNCILLLFIILSVMFAASSVNNIIAVATGLDSYFEKAGLTDLFYIAKYEEDGTSELNEVLGSSSAVKSVKYEDSVFVTSDNFKRDGKKLYDFTNIAFVMSIDHAKLNYFDKNNDIITNVEKGKVYITNGLVKKAELETGDKITFEMNGTVKEFEFAGIMKDAFLGSEMMANYRFIINNDDYSDIIKNEETAKHSSGGVFYVTTDDAEAVLHATTETPNIYFSGKRSMINTTYMMNILVAAIVLVVSVCLILVSFVVLRFTIGFTIAEEFREIGVMKAVGLKNSSIRTLYLVKYFGIAIVGAVIGFIFSFPFGKTLIASVSENMVLENDDQIIIGLLSSLVVIAIIMLFCYRSTAKIKKLSPIDAVRNGQTGERFGRRGLMSLSKSRLGTSLFMAGNDVLSSPRQYSIITLVFALSTMLVMILSTTANSLNSEGMVTLLAVKQSDVYIADTPNILDIMYGKKTSDEAKAEVAQKLKDNGMEADVMIELWFKLPVSANGKEYQETFLLNRDSDTTDYDYTEGSAPRNSSEIAITGILAEKLDVGIGDKIKLTINGEQKEYLITALFQCFNNLGEVGRLHQSIDISDSECSSAFDFQATFKDNPDHEEIEKRIEKIEDVFECTALDTRGFVDDCTGVSSTIASVKNYLLILSMIIIIMISVLMERSFISKEKSEIALLKAIGFKSSDVMLTHTLRFMITGIVSVLIAMALCSPVTRLIMDPIFAIMGADNKIPYETDPVELFVFIPIMIILATTAAVFITSAYTKTIKAQDTANIE